MAKNPTVLCIGCGQPFIVTIDDVQQFASRWNELPPDEIEYCKLHWNTWSTTEKAGAITHLLSHSKHKTIYCSRTCETSSRRVYLKQSWLPLVFTK